MINELKKDAESRMRKSVDALGTALNKIRTGRAHPSLLDGVRVSYYGSEMPLSQVANITVEDGRMLVVTPWEKNMVPEVEKAIMKSDLGLNPSTAGTVIRLPMPAPLQLDGMRLPASYANFYIANAVVLVPTFNDPNDRIALGILSELFPDRPVVGIHAVDLVLGQGTIHCLTQQEPAV